MPDWSAGSKILLVEDDDDIRELFVTLFSLAGLVPTACRTAEQALGALRHERFDMLLTDGTVQQRLAPSPRRPNATARGGPRRHDHDENGECPDPIELILYVNHGATRSPDAIASIEDAVARFASSRVRLTLFEVPLEPGGAAGAGGFTREARRGRAERPRTFILGHVTNPEIALELLESCDGRS